LTGYKERLLEKRFINCIYNRKSPTSILDMQADELDPEICGRERSAEPNFPTLSLEVVQQFASTAEREDSERHDG
jgi:hypothetical protein